LDDWLTTLRWAGQSRLITAGGMGSGRSWLGWTQWARHI